MGQGLSDLARPMDSHKLEALICVRAILSWLLPKGSYRISAFVPRAPLLYSPFQRDFAKHGSANRAKVINHAALRIETINKYKVASGSRGNSIAPCYVCSSFSPRRRKINPFPRSVNMHRATRTGAGSAVQPRHKFFRCVKEIKRTE